MGEPFPLDALLASRRPPAVDRTPPLEHLVVLVEFVGGPQDGLLAWLPPACRDCGKPLLGHPFRLGGTWYVAYMVLARGKYLARPRRQPG